MSLWNLPPDDAEGCGFRGAPGVPWKRKDMRAPSDHQGERWLCDGKIKVTIITMISSY